jgi:hypothetical protein
LLDFFQEFAGFTMVGIEVEGQQHESLGGDEVPVAIPLGDEPEMETGNLEAHLAQPSAFGVHVSAERADGKLSIST